MPESGYQVVFESYKVATDMVSGKTVSADIAIESISPMTWPRKSDHKNRYAVNLSYHWLNHKGEPVIFDGLRSPLPGDVGAAKPDGGASGEKRSGSIEPLALNINFHCVGGSTLDR